MMTTISGALPQFQAPCPRPCHRRRRGCSTWHSSLHWWRRWHRDDDIVTIGDEDVWGFSVLMNDDDEDDDDDGDDEKGNFDEKRLTHHIARAATATKPMLPVSHQSELNLKISDHKSLWLGKIISIFCAVCLKYFLEFSFVVTMCRWYAILYNGAGIINLGLEVHRSSIILRLCEQLCQFCPTEVIYIGASPVSAYFSPTATW